MINTIDKQEALESIIEENLFTAPFMVELVGEEPEYDFDHDTRPDTDDARNRVMKAQILLEVKADQEAISKIEKDYNTYFNNLKAWAKPFEAEYYVDSILTTDNSITFVFDVPAQEDFWEPGKYLGNQDEDELAANGKEIYAQDTVKVSNKKHPLYDYEGKVLSFHGEGKGKHAEVLLSNGDTEIIKVSDLKDIESYILSLDKENLKELTETKLSAYCMDNATDKKNAMKAIDKAEGISTATKEKAKDSLIFNESWCLDDSTDQKRFYKKVFTQNWLHTNKYITGLNLSEYSTDAPDGVLMGFDSDAGEMVSYKGKLIFKADLPKKVKIRKLKDGGELEDEIIGYNALIKFNDANEDDDPEEVFIKVGSFDEESATQEEIEEDESVFFYLDSPEEIEDLKKEGVEDFIVVSAEPVYDKKAANGKNISGKKFVKRKKFAITSKDQPNELFIGQTSKQITWVENWRKPILFSSEKEANEFNDIIKLNGKVVPYQKIKAANGKEIDNEDWKVSGLGGQYIDYKLGTIHKKDDGSFMVKYGVNEAPTGAETLAEAKSQLDKYTDNKIDYNKLSETNTWGLFPEDIRTIEEEGSFESGHWVLSKINGEYEAVRDGLYMEVFKTLEDLVARKNKIADYEYSEEKSEENGEETFVDSKGNEREYKAADGKEIYEGKTKEQVWNSWTVDQRIHFIKDHDKNNLYNAEEEALLDYDDIHDTALSDWIGEHMFMGSYGDGGPINESDLSTLKKGVSIKWFREYLNKNFRDSFGFTVNKPKKGTQAEQLISDDEFRGIKDDSLILTFPSNRGMCFNTYQGSENTYFNFVLYDKDSNGYVGGFGFKDDGDVDPEYITRFVALLMQAYGYPFTVKHTVAANGKKIEKGNVVIVHVPDETEYSKLGGGGGVDQKIIDELWKGYASAILFTENDSDTEEPLENNYSISDFDEKTVKSSKILLKKFYSENKEAIIESELKLFTVGSNVWYTRAGHGVGFFDHNLDLDLERKLTKGAKALGEYPNVESYDGKISVRGGRVFSKGGGVESKQNEVYIEYYNKDKNFSIDKKYFKTYEDAVKWAQKNFDKFDPDMIKYVYAKGGDIVNFMDAGKGRIKTLKFTLSDNGHFESAQDFINDIENSITVVGEISKPANGAAANGSVIRADKSALLKYVNFKDNWHINLLELNPNRNQNGLKYKNNNKYAVSRTSDKGKRNVYEFETLEKAENKFNDLVTESKTFSNVEKEGTTSNYNAVAANGKSIGDIYIDEISNMTGLRKEAVEKYKKDNSLTDNHMSSIMEGLGRKQLNAIDVVTAMSGDKGNEYSESVIEFAKSGKAFSLKNEISSYKKQLTEALEKKYNVNISDTGFDDTHIKLAMDKNESIDDVVSFIGNTYKLTAINQPSSSSSGKKSYICVIKDKAGNELGSYPVTHTDDKYLDDFLKAIGVKMRASDTRKIEQVEEIEED